MIREIFIPLAELVVFVKKNYNMQISKDDASTIPMSKFVAGKNNKTLTSLYKKVREQALPLLTQLEEKYSDDLRFAIGCDQITGLVRTIQRDDAPISCFILIRS